MRACGRERQGCLLGVLTLLFLLAKVFSYEGFYNGVFCACMTAEVGPLYIELNEGFEPVLFLSIINKCLFIY